MKLWATGGLKVFLVDNVEEFDRFRVGNSSRHLASDCRGACQLAAAANSATCNRTPYKGCPINCGSHPPAHSTK